MQELATSAGVIRYRDVGDGPPIVFVHGIFANGTLWQKVVPVLVDAGFRCITPDWPLGSHAQAMTPHSDISPRGVARLIEEFLDELDLREVTLVANDTGGAVVQLLLAHGVHDRVARVVLTPCDSFDNFLPRSIRLLQYIPRVPGSILVFMQLMRIPRLRRVMYRTLAKYPVSDEVTKGWVRPLLTDRGVRRDTARFLCAITNKDTIGAVEHLRHFTKPVLLLWARKAPFFPLSHAGRLARVFPDSSVVEVPDSFTFVALDRPQLTAREITDFIRDTSAGSANAGVN